MDAAEEKRVLRRTARQMERDLPPEYRERSGRRIVERLLASPAYRNAETVFCFVGTRLEIDTRPILLDALASGKRLCVPLCLGPGRMEARRIDSLNRLSPGRLRIPEPGPETEALDPAEPDLAVIPCLACDRKGNRLGRGGGYYDRFLARFPGTALLICRERLVLDRVPMEPFDIPVPLLLTEAGWSPVPR